MREEGLGACHRRGEIDQRLMHLRVADETVRRPQHDVKIVANLLERYGIDIVQQLCRGGLQSGETAPRRRRQYEVGTLHRQWYRWRIRVEIEGNQLLSGDQAGAVQRGAHPLL